MAPQMKTRPCGHVLQNVSAGGAQYATRRAFSNSKQLPLPLLFFAYFAAFAIFA